MLQKIEETGSIRKAAGEMKLSYRKAYYSVDQINNLAEEPVVIMIRGGKDGGKSMLTDYGKKLIAKYKNLENEISTFLEKKSL